MDVVKETCFLEIKQVLSRSAAAGEKKLVLTREDVNTIRSLLDQLNKSQQLLTRVLRHKVDVDIVDLLQFPQLRRSFINRDTDAGILKDDLQQFQMFHAAMRLVTKSVDERRLEQSDMVQSLLNDMASIIWRVLRENHISPPEPPRSGRLEEELNKTTREFLEIVGQHNKENVLIAEITIEDDLTDNRSTDLRAIYDVRNYVIVQELGSYLLLNFHRDLSHLVG